MAEREAAKQPKILSFSCARPTLAEIDLNALVANYQALRALAVEAEFMAVVKADAYGHGAVEVSHALAREGCRHFGVATLGEAKELRAAGLDERIYLMGGFFAQEAPELVELDIVPFVADQSALPVLDSAAAGRAGGFPIHLKLDTGATRLGITVEDLPDAIQTLKHCRHLTVEGVCTLLASAADPSSPVTQRQLGAFDQGVEMLRCAGLAPRYLHVANSAATVLRADAHFDMIRVGLALYGLPPVPAVVNTVKLTPVMTFKT